jgi:hypothetical protein
MASSPSGSGPTPKSESNKDQELSYVERLNIAVVSISKVKEIIKTEIVNTLNTWKQNVKVEKQCFRIIGPAGVGKTQICYQVVEEVQKELNHAFELIMVKSPVLSRDDFIIPFPVIDNGNTSFKMLYSDFVPKQTSEFGLFVIDEFSRGDHQLQQLLWQIQNEGAVHRYKFPRGWFIVCTDNPDDSQYSMDMLEDAAGLRRQLHVYVDVNAVDFLNHAIKNNFHPYVVEFIQAHPDYLYDFEAQKLGSVFANPASYEKLSDHLWKFHYNGGIQPNLDKLEVLCSGLLNVHKAQLFMDFAKDQKDINPKDIFFHYSKVEKAIRGFVESGNNAKLGELMTGFCMYLATSRPDYEKKELDNLAKFLTLVPIDTAALFVSLIDKYPRQSEEFVYITKIHSTLMKNSTDYKKKFYESIVQAGKY